MAGANRPPKPERRQRKTFIGLKDKEAAEYEFSGKFRDVHAAIAHINSGACSVVENDDFDEVQHDFVEASRHIFDALTHTHATPNGDLADDLKECYKSGQDHATAILGNRMRTRELCEMAEARACAVVGAVIAVHKTGIPRRVYLEREYSRTGLVPELGMKCSTRLSLVAQAVQDNKFVAEDVVTGNIDELVRSPIAYLARKLSQNRSNGAKKRKHVETTSKAKQVDLQDANDTDPSQLHKKSRTSRKSPQITQAIASTYVAPQSMSQLFPHYTPDFGTLGAYPESYGSFSSLSETHHSSTAPDNDAASSFVQEDSVTHQPTKLYGEFSETTQSWRDGRVTHNTASYEDFGFDITETSRTTGSIDSRHSFIPVTYGNFGSVTLQPPAQVISQRHQASIASSQPFSVRGVSPHNYQHEVHEHTDLESEPQMIQSCGYPEVNAVHNFSSRHALLSNAIPGGLQDDDETDLLDPQLSARSAII